MEEVRKDKRVVCLDAIVEVFLLSIQRPLLSLECFISKGTSLWEPAVTSLGVDSSPSRPSTLSFFLSLPSCFAVSSQRHTLYSPKKKEKKKNIHAADGCCSAPQRTHPKVLHGVSRGLQQNEKYWLELFFVTYPLCCIIISPLVHRKSHTGLFYAVCFCGMCWTRLTVFDMIWISSWTKRASFPARKLKTITAALYRGTYAFYDLLFKVLSR